MSARRIANRYQLERIIGQGAMGDVYRGADTFTGDTVAVKALKPDLVRRDPDLITRFAREGAALRQLNHPNIVKMLAAVEESGEHFLVMEFVEGGDLNRLLQEQPRLPLNRALRIALELADALARAHHLHIIHRDLKPANVLIAQDGTPRLTDFGVAHFGGEQGVEDTVVGTYAYLAPEACIGHLPTPASDIWSFGIIVYEMLAGQRPFDASSPGGIISRILNEPLLDITPIRPDLPDDLLDLLYRMLDKKPDSRLGSARLVGATLEALIQGSTSTPITGAIPVVRPGASPFATPTPTPTEIPHNLPAQTTPFVGRLTELDEIGRMLAGGDCRLITLLGPGGMGKTRLGIEVATQHRPRFPDGVYFVPLATLADPAHIAQAIAEAIHLQFSETAPPVDQLVTYLQNRHTLLVLDNFEQVAAGAELVSRLLSSAPNLRLLATSRARLNLQAECIVEVEGMAFPDQGDTADFDTFEAVQLFLIYAHRNRLTYEADDADRPAILQICKLVGGMPLGLELAASWIRSLSPAEIAAELARDIDFLASDSRDVDARHRSLRAVFEHSWELLDEAEREALKKLSVFQGPFSREGARAVAGASVRSLALLADKSLVRRDEAGFYHLHNLIQSFAAEILDRAPAERQAAQGGHCAYYAGLLYGLNADLKSHKQVDALAVIEAELENIRAAWHYALGWPHLDALRRMAAPLLRGLMISSRFVDAEELFARAVERIATERGDEARAVLGVLSGRYGLILSRLGRHAEARQHLETAVEIARAADNRLERALALQELGSVTGMLGERAKAKELVEESLALFEQIGDSYFLARGYHRLGFILVGLGQLEAGIEATQKCIDLAGETGSLYHRAQGLSNQSAWYSLVGRLEEALQFRQEALELWRKLGNSSGIAHSLAIVGGITVLLRGNPAAAKPLVEEGLGISLDADSRSAVLYVKGWIEGFDPSKCEAAVETATEALRLAGQSGNFAAVMHSNNVLSMALLSLGQHARALPHVIGAMKVAAAIGSPSFICLMLGTYAAYLARSGGDLTRAVRFYALARAHPLSPSGWMTRHPLFVRLEQELREKLSKQEFAAAWQPGTGLDPKATIAEVLAEVESATK